MTPRTRACVYAVTGEFLREKLGLPLDVQIVAVGRDALQHDCFSFTLHGIGPNVRPGDSLLRVAGNIHLETEGDLQWVIKP